MPTDLLRAAETALSDRAWLVEAELGGLEGSELAAGDVVEFDQSFLGLDPQFGRHLLGIGQLGLADGPVGDQFIKPGTLIPSNMIVYR